MGIITLLTDWGTRDHYVAALKGELLSQAPGATLVDVSHQIKQHDIIEGAYTLRNAWHHFPKGTVHLIGLIGHATKQPATIAIQYKDHFFIGCNDGLIPLAFQGELDKKVYLLTDKGERVPPSMQVLADAAIYLHKGGNLTNMGTPVDDLVIRTPFQAFIEDDAIRGMYIYVDSFGNMVTNITRELIQTVGRGRALTIHVKGRQHTVDEISTEYRQVGIGQLLARFNEEGFLEMAICEGSASQLLYLKYGDQLRVEFHG